jgi:thiol-disulfide isomerase/thioredoxin
MNCKRRVGILFLIAGSLAAQQPKKHWSGVATVHGQQVPVGVDLSQKAQDGSISGNFVNGEETTPSSSGELSGSHLVLNFNYYARKLEGDINDQTLTATYGGSRGESSTLVLHPDTESKPTPKLVPAAVVYPLRGDWEVAVQSPKGESAWTLRITPTREAGQIKAVILRIDGDTGGLFGSLDTNSGEYRVSHFNASGPALYSIKQQADGTLLVTNLLRDGQQWTARRPVEARKENLAPPTKATAQTGVVDPTKPLRFTATTLDGATVTNADPRFKGKVVIVALGGSWCPNCHDEAPFLVDLYNRYHARGLEIVDLSFEEEDQLKNPQRLRAFQAHYHIPYPVLLGGTPDQVNEKIPQGKNLNCWPTAFFVGRDGLVKETHAGFSGPATGAAYVQLKAETDALVEKLLTQHNGGKS